MENVKNTNGSNATSGFKIIIVVLAVVVAAVSILFYTNVNSLKKEIAETTRQKTEIQANLSQVQAELGSMTTQNETISTEKQSLELRVQELMTELDKEKAASNASIRKYKREVNNLRALVKKYAAQITQLEAANKQLTEENVRVKTNLKNTTLRAEAAEEDAKNLSNLVKKGSVIVAREMDLSAVRGKTDREVSKMKRAQKLRIDFMLVANTIAKAGTRTVYARVIGPDNYAIVANQNDTFNYNGEQLGFTASREVDYQNQDLNVSIFFDGVKGLVKGTYKIQIYIDGYLAGEKNIVSK